MTPGAAAVCALVSCVLSVAMLLSRMRAPLGPDEGYLWFGVQQVLRGRMPHRDFRSYEPGRYLWSGLLARLFGPGLLVLRASTHLFFALGLFVALLVLRELRLGWFTVVLAGIALSAWSHPQHKQFEHAWILIAWAANAHMLLLPSSAAMAVCAATAGMALFFGFNLFLYFCGALFLSLLAGAVAGLFVLDSRMLLALAVGGMLGMLPFLLMLSSAAFARRFYQRRVSSIHSRGSSNLPLPLPWPWHPPPAQLAELDPARKRAFQVLFLAMFVVPIGAGIMALVAPGLGPLMPGIVAAAALGTLTNHHAASRADPPHIAQAMGPVCLLAILLLELAAPASTAVVVAVTLWMVWPLQPLACRRSYPGAFSREAVGGLQIDVTLNEARLFEAAAEMCAGQEAHRTGFLAAPFYPALYANLGRDSPVYDMFCVYPADERAQQEMIDSIEGAAVFAALISDEPIDGREELRFSRTHPRVWTHLVAGFHSERPGDLGPHVVAFTRLRHAIYPSPTGLAHCIPCRRSAGRSERRHEHNS